MNHTEMCNDHKRAKWLQKLAKTTTKLMQNRMTHITDKWIYQDTTKSNYKKMENPIKNRHFGDFYMSVFCFSFSADKCLKDFPLCGLFNCLSITTSFVWYGLFYQVYISAPTEFWKYGLNKVFLSLLSHEIIGKTHLPHFILNFNIQVY